MNNKWVIFLSIMLPLIYSGILLGVSFIATPIKFSAPSLSLSTALEIGKVTFNALNKLEWILVCICFVTLYVTIPHKLCYLFMFIVLVIIIAQTFFFLPILDERVALIQRGRYLKPSFYHLIYIIIEFIKILSLMAISFILILSNKN